MPVRRDRDGPRDDLTPPPTSVLSPVAMRESTDGTPPARWHASDVHSSTATSTKPIPAEVESAPKYVYDFAEGSREMRDLLGGKGANICEMTRLLGRAHEMNDAIGRRQVEVQIDF